MFRKGHHHTDDSFNIRTMLTLCVLAFICGCNTPDTPESIMTQAVKMPEWLYWIEGEHPNRSVTDEEKKCILSYRMRWKMSTSAIGWNRWRWWRVWTAIMEKYISGNRYEHHLSNNATR